MKRMNKYLAYYLRLSLDDGTINDSNSIANQRQFIKEYIYSSDEFFEAQTLEFVDDGYTGTNFDRPGITQLLEAVKKGEIKCIIVKDFSRFGRNFLEVSKYIEQLFPYIGVRFIAINDNYDSINHKGATTEIDVPIRNMINEMYSRDISQKVKSAKQTKIKQGLAVSGRTVFGYKYNTAHSGKIVIDEPAADIVRKIFQLALDGNTIFQIAQLLNAEHLPTPSEYKTINGDKMKWNTLKEVKHIWKYHSVFNILCDERYTGTFIGGKREFVKFGSSERILKPKEEWIRIPNNHPAIMTQEQFYAANKMINKCPQYIRTKKYSYNPFYKKIKCGKCGRMLHYISNTSNPFYLCKNARYNEYGCMQGKIHEKELNEAVRDMILIQINLFTHNGKLLQIFKNNIHKPNISTDNFILELNDEIKKLQSDKRKLYERYKNKEMNRILYLQEREILEKTLENKTNECEALIYKKQIHEDIFEKTQQLSQTFLQFQSTTELSKEMVDIFIEMVKVYDVDRIEIEFKFQNEFENIMKIIQNQKYEKV